MIAMISARIVRWYRGLSNVGGDTRWLSGPTPQATGDGPTMAESDAAQHHMVQRKEQTRRYTALRA